MNGPAGDLPLIWWDGAPHVLCGQGPAPAGATIAAYRSLGLSLVPGTGYLAACVPGAFDAWMTLLRDFGTWELADVAAYAIGCARSGFPATPGIVRAIASLEPSWASSVSLWQQGGARLRNPVLADTYERLARSSGATREARIDAARDAFYRGFVAEAMVAAVAEPAIDSSGTAHAGMLSGDDLAGYRAAVEDPVSFDFRGWTVFKTGPWGQGPVFLQQLALLDGLSLGRFLGVEHVHAVIECAKLAFADREAFYGDSAEVPLERLLSPSYADSRRSLVGAAASGDLRPGGRRLPSVRTGAETAAGVGEPTLRRYVPPRCRRPLRKPRLGDAERRLAAELARDPGARVRAGHAGADVLARGRAAGVACTWSPSAHDAVAVAGAARRRHRALVRNARAATSRTSGRSSSSSRSRLRPRPAGRDRRADVPYRALPELVLSALGVAAAGRDRGSRAGGDDRGASRTRPRRRGGRRLVARDGSAPCRGRPTGCCGARRTRAGCRATRSVAERQRASFGISGQPLAWRRGLRRHAHEETPHHCPRRARGRHVRRLRAGRDDRRRRLQAHSTGYDFGAWYWWAYGEPDGVGALYWYHENGGDPCRARRHAPPQRRRRHVRADADAVLRSLGRVPAGGLQRHRVRHGRPASPVARPHRVPTTTIRSTRSRSRCRRRP